VAQGASNAKYDRITLEEPGEISESPAGQPEVDNFSRGSVIIRKGLPCYGYGFALGVGRCEVGLLGVGDEEAGRS